MVTLQSKVKAALAGVCGNVFYSYPSSWTRLPCVSWRESGNREIRRADGAEHLCELIYTVDIWSGSPETNAEIARDIDVAMLGLRLKRAYSADIFETSTRLNHRALRYRAVVDPMDNIYQ